MGHMNAYSVRQAAQAGLQQYETIMDASIAAKLNTIEFHKKMAERGLSFPERGTGNCVTSDFPWQRV